MDHLLSRDLSELLDELSGSSALPRSAVVMAWICEAVVKVALVEAWRVVFMIVRWVLR